MKSQDKQNSTKHTINRIMIKMIINQTIHWASIGIIFPVLSMFFIKKGINLYQLGSLFAVFSGTIVLSEIPTGSLADAFGRKKIYLVSLILNFVSVLVLLTADQYILLIPGFILMGLGRALSSGSLDAYFVDTFLEIDPGIDLQKIMSKLHTIIPLSLAISSLLGGYLPMIARGNTFNLNIKNIYSINFIFFLIIILVQFIVTSLLIKNEKRHHQKVDLLKGFASTPSLIRTSFSHIIKNRVVLAIIITTFAYGFAFSGIEQFWQPKINEIKNIDSSTWIYGLLSFGYFFIGAIGSFFSRYINKYLKNSFELLLFFIQIVMGLILLYLSLQKSLIGFSCLYLLLYFFNGISKSFSSTLFNKSIPSDIRSTLMSFLSLSIRIGGLLGSLVLGFISENISITFSWLITAVVLLPSSLAYIFALRKPNINTDALMHTGKADKFVIGTDGE